MKIVTLLVMLATAVAAMGQTTLRKQGTATQLVVDGSPMIILGGELGNSSASSVQDIDAIFPKLERMALNTVLVPAYWDLLEPEEGQFDFTLIDHTIAKAEECHLRVVFLWFGAWKNSMSCYAPLWFKKDYEKYPRAVTREGKPLEIASAFSENVFEADSKAFTALVKHIKKHDAKGTVVMIQVENEIGMLESARDYSDEASRLFAAQVPQDLMTFIGQNKAALHPQLSQKLSDNGNRTEGTWTEVFGDDLFTEEIFMAYHYASYVERLAQIAKREIGLPLYVNAAMNSRGRQPGQYPSAGPLAHLKDVWHCVAPSIDFLSPDIYDQGFRSWVEQYALDDNPLFIPEMRRGEANAAWAFLAIGEHDAIGVSPFSIENGSDDQRDPMVQAYRMLATMMPMLTKYQGTGQMRGLLFDSESTTQTITDGDLTIKASHYFTLPWDPRATDGSVWPTKGCVLIRLADDEYVVAGSGVVLEFAAEGETLAKQKLGEDGFAENGQEKLQSEAWKGTERVGIGSVDEVSIGSDGQMQYVRRLNGDEDHQGRHVRIGVDGCQILHVRLYRYK